MMHIKDEELCKELGLSDGQMRVSPYYKNLWWSFDHDRAAFGYGDLSLADVERIYEWIKRPENRNKTFTGWNEHHGTEWQQMSHPMLRISFGAGVTRPYHAVLEMRFGG